MKERMVLINIIGFALLIGIASPDMNKAEAQISGPYIRQIASGGTTSFIDAQITDALRLLESAGGREKEMEFIAPTYLVNRSPAKGVGKGISVNSSKKAKSNPELKVSFDGLDHRDQRLANEGNQFSVEPPDQGLCVGNGYVLESINQALRIYDTDGNPLSGVVDLNTFLWISASVQPYHRCSRSTCLRSQLLFRPGHSALVPGCGDT